MKGGAYVCVEGREEGKEDKNKEEWRERGSRV